MIVVGVWEFYHDVYDVYHEKDRQSRFPLTAISLSNWHTKKNNLSAWNSWLFEHFVVGFFLFSHSNACDAIVAYFSYFVKIQLYHSSLINVRQEIIYFVVIQ